MSDGLETSYMPEARRRTLPMGPTLAALAGAALFFVGLFAVTDLWRAAETRGWPTAPGTIVESGTRLDVLTYNYTRRGRSATTATHFYVTYQYVVDGRQYTSGRIDAVTTGGADYPHEYMARYPRGADVRVHYDPTEPTEAVLETSWPIGTTIKAIIALTIAILLLRAAYRPTLTVA